jgi:hypothetical protein
MTNNKQQTAVEWLIEQLRNNENIRWRGTNIIELGVQAKEKYEHEMCEFATEYAAYELQQNKPGIKGAMVSMCAWTFFKSRRQQ